MILTGRSVFFFAILVLTLWSARKGRDLFSPVRLYLLTYSLTLGITCLDLSPHASGWHIVTWCILLVSGIAYSCGAGSIFLLNRVAGRALLPMSQVSVRLRACNQTFSNKRYGFGVLICLFSFVGAFVLGSLLVGVPAFADDPEKARIDFAFFGSAGNLICLSEVVVFLSASMVFAGHKKAFYLVLLIMAAGLSSLLLSRYAIIKMLFITAVLLRYFRGSYNWRLIAFILLLFFSIVLGGFLARTKGDYFSTGIYKQFTELEVRKGYELVALPYAYIAGNYWNLDFGIKRALDVNLPKTFGLKTFHFLIQLTNQGEKIDEALGIEHFLKLEVQKVSGFNTITHHWMLFRDFGFAGIVLFSFAMGVIMAAVYGLFRANTSIWTVNLYAQLSFMIGLSFFTSVWAQLPSWIVLVATYSVIRFSRIGNGDQRSETGSTVGWDSAGEIEKRL